MPCIRTARSHGGGKTRRTQTALARRLLLRHGAGHRSNFQQTGITAGTDAGKAGFLTALYVVLVPVFGLFFRRKVSLPVWIAVVLSVVSLYLLCIKGSFRLAAGDLLVLVCAVCFAVHILVIDHFGATCDGVKLSCVQFLFAGLWSAVCIPFFEHVDAAALLSCALPLLYVACSRAVWLHAADPRAEGLQPHGRHHLLSLESVFAVIAGAIILHQHMTPREYLGCALMFLAVVLAQIPLPAKAAARENKQNPAGRRGFRTHAAARKCPLHFCPNWAIILVKKFTESVCTRRSIPHETDTRTTGRARRQQGRVMAKVMKTLVMYGDAFGAERWCPSRAPTATRSSASASTP